MHIKRQYLLYKAFCQVKIRVVFSATAVVHHLLIIVSSEKDCRGIEEVMPSGNFIDETKTRKQFALNSKSEYPIVWDCLYHVICTYLVLSLTSIQCNLL